MNSRSVIINGQIFYQQKRGNRTTEFCFAGQYYETPEELQIAEMLTLMAIKFMHHVIFEFRLDGREPKNRIWCPDFILDRPYRWVGKTCNGSVIIGLEAKRSHVRGMPRLKSRALLATKGIPILLVNQADIEPYYQFDKKLPLIPLRN